MLMIVTAALVEDAAAGARRVSIESTIDDRHGALVADAAANDNAPFTKIKASTVSSWRVREPIAAMHEPKAGEAGSKRVMVVAAAPAP